MSSSLLKIKLLVITLLLFKSSIGQVVEDNDTDSADLVISYQIEIKDGAKKATVAETYNSGTKTIFISKDKARVRLLSLMRIESVFFLPSQDSSFQIFRVKESGRKFNPEKLTLDEWKKFNAKYDSTRCELVPGDTKEILDYNCKRAIIHLLDGRTIKVYYTEEIKPLKSIYEPAFASLPGLVLEYSYSYKNGSSTYTATSILRETVDPEIFSIERKYPEKIKL